MLFSWISNLFHLWDRIFKIFSLVLRSRENMGEKNLSHSWNKFKIQLHVQSIGCPLFIYRDISFYNYHEIQKFWQSLLLKLKLKSSVDLTITCRIDFVVLFNNEIFSNVNFITTHALWHRVYKTLSFHTKQQLIN